MLPGEISNVSGRSNNYFLFLFLFAIALAGRIIRTPVVCVEVPPPRVWEGSFMVVNREEKKGGKKEAERKRQRERVRERMSVFIVVGGARGDGAL